MNFSIKVKKFLSILLLIIIIIFCLYDIISIKNTISDVCAGTKQLQDAINKLKSEKIPPTEDNLFKLQNEHDILQRKIEHLYTPKKNIKILYLQGNKPKNEVDFYFAIMSYVDILTEKAENNNIILPKDFKFGFDPYIQKDVIPQEETIELLYKQSKIAAKILTILFEANEHGMKFISFQRESISLILKIIKEINESKVKIAVKNDATTTAKAVKKNKKQDVKIDTAGVLNNCDQYLRRDNKESYLFALEFECYTSALRKFFNLLHDYRLPVVVRKLDISTPAGKNLSITSAEMSKVSLVLEWFLLDKTDKELFKKQNSNTSTDIITNSKEKGTNASSSSIPSIGIFNFPHTRV